VVGWRGKHMVVDWLLSGRRGLGVDGGIMGWVWLSRAGYEGRRRCDLVDVLRQGRIRFRKDCMIRYSNSSDRLLSVLVFP